MIDSEACQSKLNGGHGGTAVMCGGAPADSGHDGLGRAQLCFHYDQADQAGAD